MAGECAYHGDMKDTVQQLTKFCNTSLQWQASEETHRSNLYTILTEVQSQNGTMMSAINDMRVCLHKEFATKNDLKEVKKEMENVKQNQNKDLKFLITLTLGSGVGGGGVVAIMQYILSLI